MKQNRQKSRLDQQLQKLRPDLSRSRVQAEIMAGKVLVNGSVCDKPGSLVEESAEIKILAPDNPFVSRGGLKLAGALLDLSINIEGLVVLDVGASTGGFTDCLLQNGARRVYALDVGYGQLEYSLRQNPFVVVMERFNVRSLKPADIPETPDLAVVDVSFISLVKVLPVLFNLSIPEILALVKPQFEVGRADAGKGRGVIKDPDLHQQVLCSMVEKACKTGYCCQKIVYSRYSGPKGNIEYFIYLSCRQEKPCFCEKDYENMIAKVVEEAHTFFGHNRN